MLMCWGLSAHTAAVLRLSTLAAVLGLTQNTHTHARSQVVTAKDLFTVHVDFKTAAAAQAQQQD